MDERDLTPVELEFAAAIEAAVARTAEDPAAIEHVRVYAEVSGHKVRITYTIARGGVVNENFEGMS